MEWTWGWAAVIVAVVAAGFAGWQAFEARRARVDAGAAQQAAEDAAKVAAAAQAQSADSLAAIAAIVTEQHEIARAAAEKKPDPWRMESGRYVKTGTTRMLVLGGEETLIDVELSFENHPRMLNLTPREVPSTWRPGDAIEIYWYGNVGAFPVLEVRWRREAEEQFTVTRATLR